MEAPARPPPTSAPAARGWWSRNWKWVVPTGCLSFAGLACAFVTAIAFIVLTAVKSSDAYKMAVARAKSDPRVIEAIGTPINEAWWVAGSTEVSGGSGKSDLTIPLRGPKGNATVYALATKFGGNWQYSKLVAKIDNTGQTIDLIETAR